MHNKIFIIAEAGVNHNGSITLAKQLIDAARTAGADAVKFQTFQAEKIVTHTSPKAVYQRQQTENTETQFDMLKKLELSEDQHKELLSYCHKREIQFLSTPFDLESIDFLASLGMEIFKIPSGEITNLPHLRKIGGLNKKVILSTGMADLEEVRQALQVLVEAGTPLAIITVLHCTTEYPAPMDEVNLLALQSMANGLEVSVGYSDHTTGIEITIAAAALGATVIEKHFTLDRSMDGPDHQASLEPEELKCMVEAIRKVEFALGDGIKRPTPSELPNQKIARKSIVAAVSIMRGETFSEQNLTTKRPGHGLSPMQWDELMGKQAPRNFQIDEMIEL